MSVKIGTFNILDPNFAVHHHQKEGLTPTGQSNWPTRKQGVVKLINESNLDVICLQEISQSSLNDLKKDLDGQYAVKHIKHAGRQDGLAILYKKTFKEVNSKTFSLHGLDSGYVDLQDQMTGRLVRVANCHLLGGQKQDQGKQQIEKLLERVENDPCRRGAISARIITGDFNSDEKQLGSLNSKFDALQQANYQFDGDLTPTEIGKGRHIDWIWIRADSRLSHLNIPQSKPVSDHALIATQITFKATSSAANAQSPISKKAHSKIFKDPPKPTKSPSKQTVAHSKPLKPKKPSRQHHQAKVKPLTLGERLQAVLIGIVDFFAKSLRLR